MNARDKYRSVLEAADALERKVFLPKIKSAQDLEDAFGSATWNAEGSDLVAEGGTLVVSASSSDLAAYLSEYDPASVRRASNSKRAAVTRMRDAVENDDSDAVEAAWPAFMNLVREYQGRTGLNPESVERETPSMSAEEGLLQRITDMAERGYRAAQEPDDGGPEYLIQRSQHMDWESWFNAIRWAFQSLSDELELEVAASLLDHMADRLEEDEGRGVLETGMQISGTDTTSYSARARDLAKNLRLVRGASEVPVGVVWDELQARYNAP